MVPPYQGISMNKIRCLMSCCLWLFACDSGSQVKTKNDLNQQASMDSGVSTELSMTADAYIDQPDMLLINTDQMLMQQTPCVMPEQVMCDGKADGPSVLNEHTAIYDEKRLQMVIFGGNTAVPENCGFPSYTGESITWIYYDYQAEGCEGPWVKLESEISPPGRARHHAVIADDQMWVFGGRVKKASGMGYDLFNDLWSFDLAQRSWTEILATNPPTPRYNSAFVYDSKRKQLWLFGGNTASSALSPNVINELWKYDLQSNAWTQIEINERSEATKARLWHTGIYDEQRDRLVFFGGADQRAFESTAVYFNDLSFYYPAEDRWESISPLERPDGRFWGQMIYQKALDQYVLFGGHDDQALGNRNDTWIFKAAEGLWEMMGEEDIFLNPATDFCEIPTDFSTNNKSLPERRNAHSFVWSNQCQRGLIFGGKTDCGAINDVWRLENQAWQRQYMATQGEACGRWRSNPDNCVNLCF
jgi:N-acetylneuraminic acid mutarotase